MRRFPDFHCGDNDDAQDRLPIGCGFLKARVSAEANSRRFGTISIPLTIVAGTHTKSFSETFDFVMFCELFVAKCRVICNNYKVGCL